ISRRIPARNTPQKQDALHKGIKQSTNTPQPKKDREQPADWRYKLIHRLFSTLLSSQGSSAHHPPARAFTWG
ncbi:MAG: hypothetical protein ACXVW2_17015, partial [Nocardioidaceae bacterium]